MSAASIDFFQLLLDYSQSANAQIMDRAREASESDYLADADGLSFGSLHATLIHIMTSEIIWIARWTGETPPEWVAKVRQPEEIARKEIPSLAALSELWQENSHRFRIFGGALTDEAVSARLAYRDLSGTESEQPLRELIAHVVNHGTQYRAEASVRLTQLGLSPGDMDFVAFARSN